MSVASNTRPTRLWWLLGLVMVGLVCLQGWVKFGRGLWLAHAARGAGLQHTGLHFEVSVAPGLLPRAQAGRIFIVLGQTSGPEPRLLAENLPFDAPPVLAHDIAHFASGKVATVDSRAAIYPLTKLADLPAGDYSAQAVFDASRDHRTLNAPGNLYSPVQQVSLDPAHPAVVKLELTQKVPPLTLPPDDEYLMFIRIRSELLSRFHHRPYYLRAGLILPRDYDKETSRRYPLRIHIGGYGARFTHVQHLMAPDSDFRKMWLADDTPRMIFVHLDGDGPYGDPYQINSANNGPFGDAVTRELIPYIENHFRGIGQPSARVLDGVSTGGWAALALQIFYPRFFNGAWASCPDPVDFRDFELVNIYNDRNAYVTNTGQERASKRTSDTSGAFTVRHECQLENVLGQGDSYTMSGQAWGAWNAVFGPRGANGRPLPLWDPRTGAINRTVAAHWRAYDLRLRLQNNWKRLAPLLRGKLHICAAENDDYFLNNAVHHLDAFLSTAQPPYGGTIVYGPGQGHGWMALTEPQLMAAMGQAVAPAATAKVP